MRTRRPGQRCRSSHLVATTHRSRVLTRARELWARAGVSSPAKYVHYISPMRSNRAPIFSSIGCPNAWISAMLSASARKSKLVAANNKKSKGATTPASTAAAAMSSISTHTLCRGTISAAATHNLGRGGGLVLGADAVGRTIGHGSGSAAAAATRSISSAHGNNIATAPSSIDGSSAGAFPAASSSGFPSTAWWDSAAVDPVSPSFVRSSAWDPSWDKDPCPPGGFMRYFGNQPHNFHLVGAPVQNHEGISPTEVQIMDEQQPELVDSDSENVRTEKRIAWIEDEDVSLMSAWIEHSTDSTCGADKGGSQYWSEVVASYNKTTPLHRKRNLKQCKDRWHKINRWSYLFECAYAKARRVFTSGYSDQMWIDAAHKFYVADNKEAKLGPFVLMEVWKICRGLAKWKTYNEQLLNARKRKSFHLEEGKENDGSLEEMPKRPIGQKAAKKAALAAKVKSKLSSSDDDGHSKESAIDLDKLDRFSKFQEETNEKRMKLLELQQKLSSEKLETTKLAHLTAQETKEGKKLDLEGKKLEKEAKMMEAYNSLIAQDTSSMSDEEKVERVVAMKCLRKALFPETI